MKNNHSFPLLKEFARGYLHQDMVPEYGNAQAAAKVYVADLSAADKKALAAEARTMVDAASNWTNEEVNQQLHRMGAGCNLGTRDEFIELLRMFEKDR